MFMKRIVLAAAVTVGAFAAVGCSAESFSIERGSVNGLPTVSAKQTGKAEWKVDAVDYENRSVALTNDEGVSKIFKVRADTRNLQKVKKGMTVKAEYSVTLHAAVRKIDAAPRTSVITSASSAPDLEGKPGLLAEREAWVESKVKSIDQQTRLVQLELSNGDVMSMKADNKLPKLENVHPGDQVVFYYTEALKISVD